MDDWSMFERARPHRKWRPNTSIISSPKRWWQFAINRQLEQIRNKNICRESKALFARLHLVNTYCKAYRHRLNCFLTSQLKGSQNVSSPSFDANKLTINAPKYSHEETTLIKQIEHGADFSYTDLHVLREAVFQKMLSELKLQFSSNTNENSRTSSPFQIIEAEQEIKEENNNISKIGQQQVQQQNGGGGWLNWMTNWFGSEEKNNEFLEKENDLILNDSVYLNNLSTPKLTSPRRDHALNPELEEIEKRMETEILQMLNDTLDDYNILRRDNLLAELVINFARVHLRIATDKASKQENNEKQQQKINLLMLTFDLDQLNGRIQISPKEHRTEMSINVGDLSIQQMQQQQQHFINNSEERKKDSNNSSKNNDDSLFCGFQEDILSNSDITTNLLFTIGRRNENKKTNNNFSSIVELFYKRLAPKMEIYHELNICCAPLAMLADDCFIATLREIVGRVEENNKSFQHSTPSTSNFSTTFKSSDESSLIFHQIFIFATIPELLIELRSQKAAQDCILSTLPKHRENCLSSQNNQKRTRRKRTSNSILFPLNFDINDVCNNVGEEEFNVEANNKNSEHQKNTTTNVKNYQNLKQTSIKTGKYEQNINKNKNTTTKTFGKNKLVFTPTTSNEHPNFTTIETSSSSSFVLASVYGLSFTFIKKHLQQQKLNKINVGFDSFNLKDLFEKTTNKNGDMLLKIGKEKAVSPNKDVSDGTVRSLSCPDLTTNNGSKNSNNNNNISPNKTTENSDSSSNLASTSLLNENLFVGETENNVCISQTMPTTKQQIENNVSNVKQNQKKKHCIEVVFVPNKHEVETSCKKANCIVTGNFDDEQTNVELFINRRTWLLLIDFFGFCSTSDINNKNVLDNNNNNYIMNIELNISSNLILSINYPKSELTPKLGIVYIQKPTFTVQIDLNVSSDPILISMQAHSFSLTDENSQIYSQRLRVGNFDNKLNGKSTPCIKMKLIKNRRNFNSSLNNNNNDFDIYLNLKIINDVVVNYIHSHRYYYALIDFWLQFSEIYDRLFIENEINKQSKQQLFGQQNLFDNLLKLRCKLDIEFTSGLNLYIPSSENSQKAVLFECDKILISNKFCRASQIKNLLQKHLGENLFRLQQQQLNNNSNENASPLLDDINIKIQHYSVYYGNFCKTKNINKNERISNKNDFTAYTFHKLQSVIENNNNNNNIHQEIQLYRNLSARTTHAGGFIF
uniref:Uncharacterized protein n=1 Tax=Meloidogyne enterolobii TaxID=390850 RepID=A0A6V7TWC7_MELEN|nr:unnamed protein product [Meloidogyne enterolobii]